MNYNDFLKQAVAGNSRPLRVASGLTQGFVKCKPIDGPLELAKREQLGTDYAVKYRLQEERHQEEEELNQLEEVDGLTSIAGTLPNPEDLAEEPLTQVYDLYKFDNPEKDSSQELVVHKYKEEILEALDSNRVLIVKGHTGCGKSTQIPVMILKSAQELGIHCNIVVTQPRRIATMSVAKRVANERDWGLGTIIGYQISLEKKKSPDTRLLYCTTGVLLEQLVAEQTLSAYTHIIIDEVHERDMNTDFLLILVKKFLKLQNCNTKIILMSATVDTQKFSEYFRKRVRGETLEPPIIDMSHATPQHTTSIYYLEHLKDGHLPVNIPEVKLEEPGISRDMMEVAALLIEIFHKIDEAENEGGMIGSVLVFLPGINEIESMYDCLMRRKERKTNKEEWMLRPLHSTVTFEEQASVFLPAPPNHRKIILATNIAESSITVNDAKYVIDFGLMKYQRQEADSGYSSLQMGWMSKSQAAQRAGRVGRVMRGRVYRLIPEYLYECLPQDTKPEILTSPLDVLVLKAKQLSPDLPPARVLAFAMDPPDLSNILRTILTLKQLGGLSTLVNGEYFEDDGELTFVGKVMASLPIDISLSKLILMGHKFSLLTDAIVIASTLAVRSVFSSPFKKQLEAYNSKIAWSDLSCSDAIASKLAYEVWRKKHTDGFFSRSAGMKDKQFAEHYFVQIKSLNEVSRLQEDITLRLKRLNIVEPIKPSVRWNDSEKPLVFKIMIAGAFYPNYFLRRPVDEKYAVKILGGRDPFNTCYVSGFPMDQPGPLYAEAVKNYFNHCGSDITVSFDGSSKVYLEFGNSTTDMEFDGQKPALMPGFIQMALYRAIKLRQLKRIITIPLLHKNEAQARWAAISKSAQSERSGSNKKEPVRSNLISITSDLLAVNISHNENPSKFFVQIAEPAYIQRLAYIYNKLNIERSGLQPLKDKLEPGMIIAAPYIEKGAPRHSSPLYFRAKIKAIGCGQNVQVFFIDYGNTEWVAAKDLKDVDPTLKTDPEIALECTLTEIQPSVMSNRNGQWSHNAGAEFDKYFKNHTDPMAYIKIYSVVNNIVSVILFKPSRPGENQSLDFQDSFNYHLIKSGFADRCEEPYLSRENHLLRENAKKKPDLANSFNTETNSSGQYVQSPKPSECIDKVVLKGPMSPLEMQLFSMTQKCQTKTVRVDQTSVNSVLLDAYPMDPHERMLVAGLVNQSPNGENLILRQTTLMPNIHGLLALITLIFSPSVELRVDAERTRFTGALCGLGCDPVTHQPYDPENDMEVAFDVTFTLDDLEQINKLRHWMNQVVMGGKDWRSEYNKHDSTYPKIKIHDLLLKILLKKRPSQGYCARGENYKWGLIDEKFLLNPRDDDEPEPPSLYPLIYGVLLKKSSSADRNAQIKRNLDRLDEIVLGVDTLALRTSIDCELCHVSLEDNMAVKFHISSSMHREALYEHQKSLQK